MRERVVVVGAGPVGLMLAGDLAHAGVPVVLVEQLAEPMTESRAALLNARTAELLAERGLGELLATAQPETVSHFGGIPVDVSVVDSPWAGSWKVPQYRTEAALARRALDAGVEVLRGHELVGLSVRLDHVTCDVLGPDGRMTTLFADYVVGCDGETSTVRELGGFTSRRAEPTRELLRADVTGIDVPPRRFERLEQGVAIAATREDVTRVMVHEFGRVVGERAEPPKFVEVADVWAVVTGEDISAGVPVWVDAFDNAAVQVTEYRRGRVLLAGDAAHRHLPVGGQALNVGLQDAVNLAWKLAGAVLGWASPALLDSYHAERHPVGAATLDLVIAQELLLFGRHEVEPARSVLGELLALPQAYTHVANQVSGVGIRYGESEHPLVGTRLHPRDGELSGDGRGVLIDRSALGRPTDTETATAWRSRVRVVRAPAREPGGAELVLVRPDGHVAWVDGADQSLRAALARWFGPR